MLEFPVEQCGQPAQHSLEKFAATCAVCCQGFSAGMQTSSKLQVGSGDKEKCPAVHACCAQKSKACLSRNIVSLCTSETATSRQGSTKYPERKKGKCYLLGFVASAARSSLREGGRGGGMKVPTLTKLVTPSRAAHRRPNPKLSGLGSQCHLHSGADEPGNDAASGPCRGVSRYRISTLSNRGPANPRMSLVSLMMPNSRYGNP